MYVTLVRCPKKGGCRPLGVELDGSLGTLLGLRVSPAGAACPPHLHPPWSPSCPEENVLGHVDCWPWEAQHCHIQNKNSEPSFSKDA